MADWTVARLCEWPTATFLAASWEDIGMLLDHSIEDEREIERLNAHIKDLNHDMEAAVAEANWKHSQGEDYGSY